MYPAKSQTLKQLHVTTITFITLYQIHYQNAGKSNIKTLRKQILLPLRKLFAFLLKALIVFEMLVSTG